MKTFINVHKLPILTLILLWTSAMNAQQLYTEGTGSNPTWDELIKKKILPYNEKSTKGVTGTDINVKNDLVEIGLNKNHKIIQSGLKIHTLGNSVISRKNFHKWTRWYQEDGNTQVFRLFPHEEDAIGKREKIGGNTYPRIESFYPGDGSFDHGDKKWNSFAATYTIIEPHDAMIFQSKNSGPTAWSVGLQMNTKGDLLFKRRRGSREVIAKNMVGKPFHIYVRDNGLNYEFYFNGGFVGSGFWERPEHKTTFRWGMYSGRMYKKRALMFVTGAVVNPKNYNYKNGGNYKHSCVSPRVFLSGIQRTTCPSKGSLKFSFSDHPNRTNLEISLDNGKTYPYSVADSKKTFTINNLSPEIYKIWVRWGNDDCPVGIGELDLSKEGKCNDNGGGNNNGGNSCNFGTPSSSGIPAMDKISFNKAYVVGSGGPSMSNFKKFSINWNPKYNGLYQFAINTKNGSPNWYIDFTEDMSYQLKNSKPEVTLRKTGFANLDGSYWVNRTSSSLILKSKTKNFSIHFTNSASKPGCANKISNEKEPNKIDIAKNPFSNTLEILGFDTKDYVIELYAITGAKVLTRQIDQGAGYISIETNTIPVGMYFLKVKSLDGQISFTKKLMKE